MAPLTSHLESGKIQGRISDGGAQRREGKVEQEGQWTFVDTCILLFSSRSVSGTVRLWQPKINLLIMHSLYDNVFCDIVAYKKE